MSRELIFYPAYKDLDTGKYKPLILDNEGDPASIFWRSGSFIDLDFFTNELRMLHNSEFEESCREYFVGSYNFTGEAPTDDDPTYIYELEMGLLTNIADDGLVAGYIPIEDAEGYYASDDKQEYLAWCMAKPIPAELYADLPEKEQMKYVKFAAIDRYSTGYICNMLLEVLWDLWLPFEINAERCMLVRYSF